MPGLRHGDRGALVVSGGDVRPAAVAGSFYPGEPGRLRELTSALLSATTDSVAGALPLGLLVPHAGLEYSGMTAAAAWSCLAGTAPTVVILGTNHRAGWLRGVAAWESGWWSTPGGEVAVDEALAAAVLALGPPFAVDRAAHRGEHSIEVQLPVLTAVAPAARLVPLAVSCGTGARAVEAGERLGECLAAARAGGMPVILAISSDMAHYPPAEACAAITERLLPPILALGPERLAALEDALRDAVIPGLACGMCGIEPAVLGLAALRAMGASRGTALSATTSADAGGPPDRTVGYLAVRFDP